MTGPCVGLDLGSRSVKVTVMAAGRLLKLAQYDTIEFYREYARKDGERLAVDFVRLDLPETAGVVSTGYGRLTIAVAGGKVIPEIKAHVLGACWQTGLADFTLLDLGGQDSKIAKVREGKMLDFKTNDRCAASSGRYLENMAGVLGVTLEELSRHSDNPVQLDATCAVFGESELIGKIVEGHPPASLAAGVNWTIFRRIQPMLQRLRSDVVVFTGGVARNEALRQIIAAELGVKVVVPEEPQYNGAIGCCLAA